MERRLELDCKLKSIMDGHGSVYFQPPPSYKLTYPCLIYELDNGKTDFAGNMPYLFTKRYSLTLIGRNPDTSMVTTLATSFPMITFDRAYASDNLYHYAYTLYY